MEELVIKIPSLRGQRNVPFDVSFNLVREAPHERAAKHIAIISDFPSALAHIYVTFYKPSKLVLPT